MVEAPAGDAYRLLARAGPAAAAARLQARRMSMPPSSFSWRFYFLLLRTARAGAPPKYGIMDLVLIGFV